MTQITIDANLGKSTIILQFSGNFLQDTQDILKNIYN